MIRWICLVGLIIIFGSTLAFTTRGQEEKELAPIQAAYDVSRAGTTQILGKSCATSGCHSGAYPKAKLNLEAEKFHEAIVDVPSIQIEKLKLVDTKDPHASYLLMKIRGDEGIVNNRMPINAPPLSADDVKTIRLWIHTIHIIGSD